jgi:tetratricopeptide (TPR) repeat protein
MPEDWPIALIHALKLAVLAALFVELVTRTGGAVARVVMRRRPGESYLLLFGSGFLLGLGALSGAILGLALTGLYYPAVIVAAFLVVPATGYLARRDLARRELSPLLAALKESRELGWPAAAALTLALVPVLSNMLTPELEMDSLFYHLGAPWQFLLAHRARLENVPFLFQMSLPIEMVFSIPLVLGDDRLAKVISFGCFIAATAVFAGRSLKRGGTDPVWQGTLLALATGGFYWLVASSKSDMFAASAFVAGALLAMEGHGAAGAVLLGLAVAGKPVYAPLAAAWLALVLVRPDAKRRIFLLVLFVLPVVPWLVKAWLAAGDPAFPLFWRLFDPPAWGAWNQAALNVQLNDIRPRDSSALSSLPVVFAMHASREQQLLLLISPGLLFFGRCRYRLAVLVAGGMAVLAGGHMPRYLLPAFWLAALFAAEEAGRLDIRLRKAVIGAVLLVLGSRLAPQVIQAPWRNILHSPGEVRKRSMAIFGATMKEVAVMSPGRIILQGEYRNYLIPSPVVFGGFEGDTPLIWKLARESADARRLDVKFRQTGARMMLYNYVRARALERRYVHFPWTDRALALYRNHVRTRSEIVMWSAQCDHMDGGFYLYRLRGPDEASGPRPVLVPFLPGAEGLMGLERECEMRGDRKAAEEVARGLIARLPEVGLYYNVMGFLLQLDGEWGKALAMYRRTVDAGIMDDENWSGYAVAAMQVGRYEDADRALRKALEIYPMRRLGVVTSLATCDFQWGGKLLLAGQYKKAEKVLRDCLDILVRSGLASEHPNSAAIAEVKLAEALARQGRRDEALAALARADDFQPGASRTEDALKIGLPPESVTGGKAKSAPGGRPRE